MKHVTRRTFCTGLVSTLGGLSLARTTQLSARQRRRARQGQDQLRIQSISPVTFYPPYHDYHRQTLFRYHGQNIQARTVYRVTTNLGLTGYGECWGTNSLTPADFKPYLGTSPFDWIGQRDNLSINMALYDLMGKYLQVPAWKLLGPQVRTKIPVAFWTVSQTPDALAEEVRQAVQAGYRWLKYHVDEVQNVVDQTRAMQAVAPRGFQVHYDFNANALLDDILPLLKQLETFPVAGRFEDPIVASDQEGWKKIRQQIKRPILGHHVPLDFIRAGLLDGYMAGHAPIGMAMKVAALAEETRVPIMLQQCGGTLNQAFLAHEASVFPAATIDHVNLTHLWREDVTDRLMPVIDGHVTVPAGPGLGIQIDEKKLADMARQPVPAYQPFLVRIRYQDGPTIYSRHNPDLPGATDNLRFLDRLLGKPIPGPKPAYDNAVLTHLIDASNESDFARLWQATNRGPLVVAGG
ncbi:MAG: enolase C-terminal domain-like protein [Pirellulaceae bacterium]